MNAGSRGYAVGMRELARNLIGALRAIRGSTVRPHSQGRGHRVSRIIRQSMGPRRLGVPFRPSKVVDSLESGAPSRTGPSDVAKPTSAAPSRPDV